MSRDFDIAVVGSGFAGSLIAMIARRQGRSVVMIERGRHPRFAMGESSTPLANLLLEELARRYELPRLLPLTKWGSWQRACPEIGCGLKRGFTFYHHRWDEPFLTDPEHRNQLLVAASPRDEIADTHWYRPDFDHWLVREAQSLGVEYVDEAGLATLRWEESFASLEGMRHGRALCVKAGFVIDASGPRGFLHRALKLPEVSFQNLPATQALFSHFTGVRRLSKMESGYIGGALPYPVDDAAVHHVFDGGWIWVLRFNNGTTSAGVALTDSLAGELQLSEGAPAWSRLLQRLPTVRNQFESASPVLPFVHAPRLSFRSGVVNGTGWALLPSAAGFVDPLLSTGFPLTLLGVARLAEALDRHWSGSGLTEALGDYGRRTLTELDTTEMLVGALYASMGDPEMFNALTLLYFAAASFSETARRLGRPELAGGFLMHDHPLFGPATRSLCRRILHIRGNGGMSAIEKDGFVSEIFQAIEPLDVAGLTDRGRRNWYPVRIDDLLNARTKFGVSGVQMKEMLRRCGALCD